MSTPLQFENYFVFQCAGQHKEIVVETYYDASIAKPYGVGKFLFPEKNADYGIYDFFSAKEEALEFFKQLINPLLEDTSLTSFDLSYQARDPFKFWMEGETVLN